MIPLPPLLRWEARARQVTFASDGPPDRIADAGGEIRTPEVFRPRRRWQRQSADSSAAPYRARRPRHACPASTPVLRSFARRLPGGATSISGTHSGLLFESLPRERASRGDPPPRRGVGHHEELDEPRRAGEGEVVVVELDHRA